VNKAYKRIFVIIIVLALAAISCVSGGGSDGDSSRSNNGQSSSYQSEVNSPDATATYGAEQLHIQLTEIARDSQQSP
jgi:hypothetical protein